ncbi:hypothetical protein [Asticcacaulis sp. AC402]|uniref:hypothetical protein n=1 Tax=Asticcacaulis sp. AC402 TaxID=1282361 RepID=UPI0003C41258|nr:hypothetical protein [Asticcacaulis sp. AC402]ESQ75765.1 hypothetical protein ABAC402_07305 [Asticcacaulis sp. AC402]
MSKRLTHATALATAVATLFLAPLSAHADGAREIQVAGRTLTFLDGGPTGKVTFAIVYDASKPASVAEKDEVMAALGSGMAAGSATIVGKPVEAGAIGSAGDVGAYYITRGVNFTAVGSAAKSKKILSIGSDMACVKAGACVMGVAATPKVEIVVNSATAAAVGAKFKAAFKMMIKEI